MNGIGIQSKAVISEKALRIGYERVAASKMKYIDYDITWEDKNYVLEEVIYEEHRCYAELYGLRFSQVHAPRLLDIQLPMDLPDVVKQMKQSMRVCQILGSPYLVVHPLRQDENMTEEEVRALNLEYLEQLGQISLEYGITVCVENLQTRYRGRPVDGICSNAADMVLCIEEVHKRIGVACLGACLDVGHAHLLHKDLGREVRTLGQYLKVLHIHDNNGETDDHQIPYSFSSPDWGGSTTDWSSFLLALREIGYKGVLSFEPYKALKSVPGARQDILLSYLYEIGHQFEQIIGFEEILQSYQGKQIIIFGAGKMLDVYMREFGSSYLPSMVVDNNKAIWESRRHGVTVYNPHQILTIPKEDRIVIICNMYFEQIMIQLEDMGIEEYILCEEIYRMNGKPD